MISTLRSTTTLRGLQNGFIGRLAFIACMSLLASPIACAGILDKLKQAAQMVQQIKHELGHRPAAKPALISPQSAAAPHGAITQPPAGTPLGAQPGSVTPASDTGNPGAVTVARKVVGPLLSDTTVIGPNGGGSAYTVSLHGSDLATAQMHGSRYVVTIDGVDGPRVDAILPSYDALSSSMGTEEAVVMSDDGRHFAYLARVGGMMVVVEDGRKLLQFPRNAYASPYHLVFSPHGGAHLLFAAGSTAEEDEVLWVDGKPASAFIPTPPGVEPVVTFSADGRHYLYLGSPQLGSSKRVLVVDGKKQSYSVEGLSQAQPPQFTADGRHVLVVTNTYVRSGTMLGKVLLDGKPVVTAEQIDSLVIAPRGSSYAAVVAEGPNGSENAVYLNGKEVPATRGKGNGGSNFLLPVAKFSPDGKHLAVACNYGGGNAYVVLDGKKGETYAKIEVANGAAHFGMQFSPDSQSFGYFADAGSRSFAVVDGHEYDPGFDGAGAIYFSAEGHHVAVVGEKADASGQVLYVDGKRILAAPGGFYGSFAFDRDGSHWMIYGQGLIVDGRSLPFGAVNGLLPRFSPDGREVAVVAEYRTQEWGVFLYNTSTKRISLLTQGTIIGANSSTNTNVYHVVFSPDSKHMYYARQESVRGQQHQDAAIYVDGEKTGVQFASTLFPPTGTMMSSGQKSGCWQVGAHDKLHALVAADNEVQRITITPPPGNLQ